MTPNVRDVLASAVYDITELDIAVVLLRALLIGVPVALIAVETAPVVIELFAERQYAAVIFVTTGVSLLLKMWIDTAMEMSAIE